MSFYRCEIKTLSKWAKKHSKPKKKQKEQSAAATHGYDSRANRRDKSDLAGSGSANMPAWVAGDVGTYWSACDQYERKNGLLARRAIVSFPTELPFDLRGPVVRDWLRENCRNMPASWHIHDEGDGNPHAHILVSERLNDGIKRTAEKWFKRFDASSPEKGGARKADIGARRHEWILDARKSWAGCLNRYLPANARVDHRSLQDRGIFDHDPQPKIGAKVLGAEKRGHRTQLMSSVIEDAARRCTVRCLSFIDPAGRDVTFRAALDLNDRIEVVGKPSRVKCREIVRMCREKGWSSVEVTGDAEFQRLMRDELRRAGIRIEGDEHEQQNSEHCRNADGRGGAEGGQQGRDGRTGGDSPGRPGHSRDQGQGCRSDGRDDAAGSDAERAETKAEAATAGATASSAGAAATDHSRPAGRAADRRSDIRALADADDGLPTDQEIRRVDVSTNLTEVQVRKQLSAMPGINTFEIGIRDGRTGKMLNIEMTAGDVIGALARLRRKNAQGCDIYIRPAPRESHPFVLLDDVGLGTINQMRAAGIVARLEVETSPQNYQVWIRLPDSLPRGDRKIIERLLAGRYGTDLNSADGGHYGRLAGFTNRKPGHIQDDGRPPFCRLSAHRPRAVLPESIWTDLQVAVAQQANEIADTAPKAHLPLGAEPAARGGVMGLRQAEASAKRQYASALKQWGASLDLSRADYSIARNLMQRGASMEVARKSIAFCSPDLESRKAGHVDDYLDRTIERACSQEAAVVGLPPLGV